MTRRPKLGRSNLAQSLTQDQEPGALEPRQQCRRWRPLPHHHAPTQAWPPVSNPEPRAAICGQVGSTGTGAVAVIPRAYDQRRGCHAAKVDRGHGLAGRSTARRPAARARRAGFVLHRVMRVCSTGRGGEPDQAALQPRWRSRTGLRQCSGLPRTGNPIRSPASSRPRPRGHRFRRSRALPGGLYPSGTSRISAETRSGCRIARSCKADSAPADPPMTAAVLISSASIRQANASACAAAE